MQNLQENAPNLPSQDCIKVSKREKELQDEPQVSGSEVQSYLGSRTSRKLNNSVFEQKFQEKFASEFEHIFGVRTHEAHT